MLLFIYLQMILVSIISLIFFIYYIILDVEFSYFIKNNFVNIINLYNLILFVFIYLNFFQKNLNKYYDLAFDNVEFNIIEKNIVFFRSSSILLSGPLFKFFIPVYKATRFKTIKENETLKNIGMHPFNIQYVENPETNVDSIMLSNFTTSAKTSVLLADEHILHEEKAVRIFEGVDIINLTSEEKTKEVYNDLKNIPVNKEFTAKLNADINLVAKVNSVNERKVKMYIGEQAIIKSKDGTALEILKSKITD